MKNFKIIEKENLLFNLQKFGKKKVLAMVKANAYGHGLKEIVSLTEDKVFGFGVVSVEEGKKVRNLTDKTILVCSKVDDFRTCKNYDLDIIVDDEKDILEANKNGLKDNIHLKINCGMNRYGAKSVLAMKVIDDILKEKDIVLQSICTHFPCTKNRFFTKKNYSQFLALRSHISQQNVPICLGGSEIYGYNFDYDILRLGIGLYGYGEKDLKPVMKVVSHVSKIFFAHKGEYIGYDKGYRCASDGFFAIVPVGYADGLRRDLSGDFFVSINDKKYRAVGRICMDAFFVKIDKDVNVGDRVVVMEDARFFARKCQTIPYEILTSFSNLRGRTIIE